MQVLASQLLFLANVGEAILPLFWPVNCIKNGGHVALLSYPTVNCLYCDIFMYGYLWIVVFGYILHPDESTVDKLFYYIPIVKVIFFMCFIGGERIT